MTETPDESTVVKALEQIVRQHTAEEHDDGDVEYGYNAIINIARTALRTHELLVNARAALTRAAGRTP